MKQLKKVKIKSLLTIPEHIKDRTGEIVAEYETESDVRVGSSVYRLKNRYFEDLSERIRRIS
jgi:hypothetical protein